MPQAVCCAQDRVSDAPPYVNPETKTKFSAFADTKQQAEPFTDT
jgi:hypothetical protein